MRSKYHITQLEMVAMVAVAAMVAMGAMGAMVGNVDLTAEVSYCCSKKKEDGSLAGKAGRRGEGPLCVVG